MNSTSIGTIGNIVKFPRVLLRSRKVREAQHLKHKAPAEVVRTRALQGVREQDIPGGRRRRSKGVQRPCLAKASDTVAQTNLLHASADQVATNVTLAA